jgi:hypothetical protein
LIAVLGNCGGTSALDASAEDPPATLGACSWLAEFNLSAGECLAGRTYLECIADDAIVGCIGDNTEQCRAPDVPPHANCQTHCAADEFALAGPNCDGTGTQPPRPAGCRFLFAVPSGSEIYCCPCGG